MVKNVFMNEAEERIGSERNERRKVSLAEDGYEAEPMFPGDGLFWPLDAVEHRTMRRKHDENSRYE